MVGEDELSQCDPPKMVSFADVFAEMAKYPRSFNLKLSIEDPEDDDDDRPLYCASLMESPPDGGWLSRGAYFRDEPEHRSHGEPPDPFRFDDACRVGISAYDPGDAARLTLGMLVNYRARAKP